MPLICYRKAAEKSNFVEEWNKTSKAKRIALVSKRANLNDFDRFCVNNLLRKRAIALRKKAK